MEQLPKEIAHLIMRYAHPIHPCKEELESVFNFYGRDLKYDARWCGFLSNETDQTEAAEYWCYGEDGWVL